MTNEELKNEIRVAYKEGFYAGCKEGFNIDVTKGVIPNWEYEYVESRAHAVATGMWSRSADYTVVTFPYKGEATNPIPPLS